MTEINSQQSLLTLTIPPKLEELMVDVLLENTSISGFTSYKVYGHGGVKGGAMSLLDQVTGRQASVQFVLHAEMDVIEGLIAQLTARFAGAGLHYVVQPVIQAGSI